MTTPTPVNNFVQRLIGAVSLDVAIYEEVEADRSATWQALLVVVLSSIAAGIGSRGFGGASIDTMVLMSIAALIGWAAWALVTLQIGGRLMPEPQTQVDLGELLRTIGFANAPGLLRVFGIIPSVSYPAFAIAAVWMLLAMVVAVRQALDYKSTGRAILVCAIGWVLSIILTVLFGLFLGPPVT
jgi:hypothetical protein